MIANGILFKADFDMSKFEDNQILKQFNPTKLSTYKEDIQATTNVEVVKESTIGDDMKIISYKSKDDFVLSQILESSIYMEKAAPRLIKVVEINPLHFIVAYPYYPTMCDGCPNADCCEDFGECVDEEDEDKAELNEKIESTVKELARVTMFNIHEHSDPAIIQENINKYVSLCFKFSDPEETSTLEMDAEELLKGTLDEILEEKFQELLGGNKKDDSAGEDTGEEDKK